MSNEDLLVRQKLPERRASLWAKLKKKINNSDAVDQPQRTTTITPPQNGLSHNRNSSHGALSVKSLNTPVHSKLSKTDSLKKAQLELAYNDHENNILNSKPILQSNKKASTEIRRASTMTSLGTDSKKQLRSLSGETLFAKHPQVAVRLSDPARTSGSLWGKVKAQYAPTAMTLENYSPTPKLARINALWDYIFEAVRDGELMTMNDPDPKIWWRKVFLNLRRVHGKGE